MSSRSKSIKPPAFIFNRDPALNQAAQREYEGALAKAALPPLDDKKKKILKNDET